MISLRRSFACSLFLTICMLLLLAACDIQSSGEPAATIASTALPETATAPSIASENTAVAPSPIPTAEPTTPPATPTRGVPQGGTLTIRATEAITTFTPWDLRSREAEIAAELLYNGLVQLDGAL